MNRQARSVEDNRNSGDQTFRNAQDGHEDLRMQSAKMDNDDIRGSAFVISDDGKKLTVESGEYVDGEFRGSRAEYDLP